MPQDKKTLLIDEIARLEEEYQQAQANPMPDKKKVDHLYKRLKKAKKEMKELEG
jgi:hypothetical protein